MSIIHKNQQHQPLPKKKRVDANGNNKKRMYFKSGNSSMLFCKGVTENAAKVIENAIRNICSDMHTTIEGTFIVTQGK